MALHRNSKMQQYFTKFVGFILWLACTSIGRTLKPLAWYYAGAPSGDKTPLTCQETDMGLWECPLVSGSKSFVCCGLRHPKDLPSVD